MQVGCGVYELEIRRHRYLYFWHYETKGGARRQVKDYVGSAGSPESPARPPGRATRTTPGAVGDFARPVRGPPAPSPGGGGSPDRPTPGGGAPPRPSGVWVEYPY